MGDESAEDGEFSVCLKDSDVGYDQESMMACDSGGGSTASADD